MTPAESKQAGEELARRTRSAQKLPKTVKDRETARKIAALLIKGRRST